ncbi:MAG: hypothetical protein E6J43_10180 [Chloroflexi bacterium]|nr:MAG: hypothetical protein E6J43_10180 [Chloroflexota bacterium]
MAKPPQLVAVVIAFVLVLGAAGYGIVRGALGEDHSSATVTTWKSATTCGTGTAQEIPVADGLSLPARLPQEVCLSNAYYSTGAPTTLWYSSPQGDKILLLSFINETSNPSLSSPAGTPIQLGNLVGSVTDTTEPDGTRYYAVSFEKSGWTYSVAARLGNNGGQDNKVTPDELNDVALSVAEQ